MLKSITTFFLFAFICFSSTGYTSPTIETNCCIKEVIGSKVYLKPTTVYVANNGIFINVGGYLHCINHLEMDSRGVYIDAKRADVGDWFVGECPVCRDATVFGICVNGACPSKQRE